MNCCDDYGNCNQGRDCPARQKPTPADELQRLQGEARCAARGVARMTKVRRASPFPDGFPVFY